jgi:hypothetical protein
MRSSHFPELVLHIQAYSRSGGQAYYMPSGQAYSNSVQAQCLPSGQANAGLVAGSIGCQVVRPTAVLIVSPVVVSAKFVFPSHKKQ